MFQGGECLSLAHLLRTWPPAISVKTILRFSHRSETSVCTYSVTSFTMKANFFFFRRSQCSGNRFRTSSKFAKCSSSFEPEIKLSCIHSHNNERNPQQYVFHIVGWEIPGDKDTPYGNLIVLKKVYIFSFIFQ